MSILRSGNQPLEEYGDVKEDVEEEEDDDDDDDDDERRRRNEA